MDQFEGKFLNIVLAGILTFLILISNIGQNFKNDLYSVYNFKTHYNFFYNSWKQSKNHLDYINKASYYLEKKLEYKLKPLNNSYIHCWYRNFPIQEFQSNMEIVSKGGTIIKRYIYGKDFFEDFKGYYVGGKIINEFQYVDKFNQDITKEIILTDLYNYKNIEELDNIFLSKNVKCVISPAFSEDLVFSSGLYDSNISINDKGLIKIIINPHIFNELKKYAKKGYKIKIFAGNFIKKSQFKDIYAVLPGKNKLLKPLIIVSYYDYYFKLPNVSYQNNEFLTTPSLVLEAINAIKAQRAKIPDRTIIFAFLSGHLLNDNLNNVYNNLPNGNVLILDNLGTSEDISISYTEKENSFANNIIKMLKLNSFYITNKNIISDSNFQYVLISSENGGDFENILKSGKFLLSLIQDECYNLGILTGNFRILRNIKKYLNKYSIPFSIITLFYLIYVVFSPKNNKGRL
ncbi:hypothetical protein SAMN05660865_01631 [Caloramator fervidus]|uniref:Peptidase family M28 n=1 Tax=Caloramator fervidus TaxID=29344 RepID=A0A1H5X1U9_9CLOT|nr:hypothetical protein [Caloramator fervidus]SEG05216.1 hypothetical protein SAMN05660865_01631 [Caloramator fervidus]